MCLLNHRDCKSEYLLCIPARKCHKIWGHRCSRHTGGQNPLARYGLERCRNPGPSRHGGLYCRTGYSDSETGRWRQSESDEEINAREAILVNTLECDTCVVLAARSSPADSVDASANWMNCRIDLLTGNPDHD